MTGKFSSFNLPVSVRLWELLEGVEAGAISKCSPQRVAPYIKEEKKEKIKNKSFIRLTCSAILCYSSSTFGCCVTTAVKATASC